MTKKNKEAGDCYCHSSPRAAGYAAFKLGKSLNSNFFEDGSKDYDLYEEGWLDAQSDQRCGPGRGKEDGITKE